MTTPDVRVLGLYRTLAGPVQVPKGREWSLFGFRERCEEAADVRRRLLFDVGAALGAHHIKVGNLYGTPCPLNQVTDELAALCTEAATHTTAAIVYEFMPFDANVNSVDKALAVVAGANADNGGIAIDTWHMGKLGISPDDLRAIPAEFRGSCGAGR